MRACKAPTIVTERLILRGKKASDAKEMFVYFSNHTVRRFLSGRAPNSLAQLRYLIRRTVSPHNWVIIDKKSGKLIGDIELYNIVEGKIAEIGYILNPDFWGKGYMSEALEGVLEVAFKHMMLHRIWLRTMSDNSRSLGLIHKFGFEVHCQLEQCDFGGKIATVSMCSLGCDAYFVDRCESRKEKGRVYNAR